MPCMVGHKNIHEKVFLHDMLDHIENIVVLSTDCPLHEAFCAFNTAIGSVVEINSHTPNFIPH